VHAHGPKKSHGPGPRERKPGGQGNGSGRFIKGTTKTGPDASPPTGSAAVKATGPRSVGKRGPAEKEPDPAQKYRS